MITRTSRARPLVQRLRAAREGGAGGEKSDAWDFGRKSMTGFQHVCQALLACRLDLNARGVEKKTAAGNVVGAELAAEGMWDEKTEDDAIGCCHPPS